MFDLEQFISDSKAALYQEPSQNSIREVVARAVSEPASVLKGLGEPKQGEMQTLYRARDLTILNVIWAPRQVTLPQACVSHAPARSVAPAGEIPV